MAGMNQVGRLMGDVGEFFLRTAKSRTVRRGAILGAAGGAGGYGAYRYRSSGRNGLRGRSSGSSPQGMAAAEQVASRGRAYNARHPFDTVSY